MLNRIQFASETTIFQMQEFVTSFTETSISALIAAPEKINLSSYFTFITPPTIYILKFPIKPK
jgi:hypothetical protein